MGRKPMRNYDYSKLRGRIKEVLGSESALCVSINRTPAYISNVFSGNNTFTMNDIEEICDALDISKSDIHLYFFSVRIA